MVIDDKEIVVSGKFPRIVRLKAEYYEYVEEPQNFVDKLKTAGCGADVCSFLDYTVERTPRLSVPRVGEHLGGAYLDL